MKLQSCLSEHVCDVCCMRRIELNVPKMLNSTLYNNIHFDYVAMLLGPLTDWSVVFPTDMRDVDPFQLAATSHRGTGKTQRGRGRTRKDGRGNIKKSTSHDNQPADSAIGSKDTSLFLFRALGKILYCKSK